MLRKAHTMQWACMSCVAERQIILSSTTCLITFCSDRKDDTPQILSIDFSLGSRQRTTPTFDIAIDITTDLVNDECVVDGSMQYSFPRSCLMHKADSYENEGAVRL